MSFPNVPEEIAGDHWMTDGELAELWHDLVVELLNPEFSNRTHNNRRTYDAGCKGPLCRKALREYARRRSTSSVNEKYRYVDLILDHWTPIAWERIREAQRAILATLTAS